MRSPLFISRTHRGKVKRNNQDCLACLPENSLAIIADGVGGNAYGEVASQMCIDAGIDYLSQKQTSSFDRISKELSNAIKLANEEIITIQQNEPKYAKMSSTMTCFCIGESHLHYAWVGDSRLYLIRPADKSINMLTHDHTLDRSKIDPEMAPQLYKKASSILTRTVGSILLLKPDMGVTPIQEGDVILACTDGLTDMVPDELILQYTLDSFSDAKLNDVESLEKLADRLLDRSLDCGGIDNVSLILAKQGAAVG